MNKEDDRLADFLNEDPTVFFNCNMTEIMVSVIAAFFSSLLPAIAIGILISNPLASIMICLMLTIVFAWFYMSSISRIREKHHEGWFKERLLLLKIQYGVKNTPLIDTTNRYRRGSRHG